MSKKESNIFSYLISNKGFIEWVKNPNESNDCFWKKWLEEKPCYRKEFIEAREFVERLQFKDEKLSENELNELLGKIIKKERTEVLTDGYLDTYHMMSKGFLKYASVIIIVLVSTFSIYYYYSSLTKTDDSIRGNDNWEIVSNPRGKRTQVILPDGTQVDLNHESTLKYPKEFDTNVRFIELEGEAFFDVTHRNNHPFVVKTGDIQTEVFGTTFNVKYFQENKDLSVSLVTGKVKVTKEGGDSTKENEVFLTPGEQMKYDQSSLEMVKSTFDIESTIAWKDGSIIFKDVGFDEFIKTLSKWYGVDFQIYGDPPTHWRFNGRYQNEKLENILLGVKFVYNINYIIQDNNIIIKFTPVQTKG